jgi:4-amino-4-deoxy-L-arabinose transferase-like glycosyltransferase
MALMVGPLVTALTGAVLYWTARRLGFRVEVAALAALAWGLGTLAWPYSRTLFTEPVAALGLSLALYGAFTFRRAAGRTATGALVFAGCGLALLTLAKQATAVVGQPLVAYLGTWSLSNAAVN